MQRFWDKVDKTPGHGPKGKCWIWTACIVKTTGYGQFGLNGKVHGAHRVAYELRFGPILDGMLVLHKCDFRSCVRHLFLGTYSDNTRDMIKKNRHAKIRSHRRIGPPGTAWCGLCREFLPVENFYKRARNWNGLFENCKNHPSHRQIKKRQAKGIL